MRPTGPVERTLPGLASATEELRRILIGLVSFGHPDGLPDNMEGQWVEVSVTALDTRVDVAHNLGVPVAQSGGANVPNVRVLSFLIQHDGQGVTGGGDTISFNYETTDAASITADSFPLRFYAAGRTVDATHPLTASLFFVKASE